MAARTKTAIVGLKVRLREPLRKKLELAAAKKGVSLNSELVSRLERSFLGEAVEQAVASKVEQAFRDWSAETRALLEEEVRHLKDKTQQHKKDKDKS